MSIEDMIRAWKADEETLQPHLPASPVGRELDEQELLAIAGYTGTFTTCEVSGSECPGCGPQTALLCAMTTIYCGGTGGCGATYQPLQP